jgi:hypothetical protein
MNRLRSMPHRRERQSGQALPLFAGGLVAFLVGTGFVLDAGLAFVSRRDSQNAADLAALAGTHVIAEYHLSDRTNGTGSDVFDAIDRAVRDNGCLPDAADPCTWAANYVRPASGYDTAPISEVADRGTIPANAQGVEVSITRQMGTSFLRVIGRDQWDVAADATAISARIDAPGVGSLLPIAFDPGPGRDLGGIDMSDFPDPPPVYQFSEGKDAPGNFSWLSWDDSNDAVTLAESICHPDNPAMAFPTYVPGGPGKMNKSQARDCLDDYIGQTVFVPFWGEGAPRCGEGPVTDRGSKTDFCIIGVAAFELLGRDFGGENQAVDGLYGRLQKYVNMTSIPEDFSGPPCNPATDPACLSFSSYLGLIE